MTNLPRKKKELHRLFKNLKTPNRSELKGDYYVDIITGLPSFKKLHHGKKLFLEKHKHFGYNVLFKKKKVFGHFSIGDTTCDDFDSKEAIMLDYNVKKNGFIMNRMIDKIRTVKKNELYLGRYYLRIFGKYRFVGYFALGRI